MDNQISSLRFYAVKHLIEAVIYNNFADPEISVSEGKIILKWIEKDRIVICTFSDAINGVPYSVYTYKIEDETIQHLEGPIDHTIKTHLKSFLIRAKL